MPSSSLALFSVRSLICCRAARSNRYSAACVSTHSLGQQQQHGAGQLRLPRGRREHDSSVQNSIEGSGASSAVSRCLRRTLRRSYRVLLRKTRTWQSHRSDARRVRTPPSPTCPPAREPLRKRMTARAKVNRSRGVALDPLPGWNFRERHRPPAADSRVEQKPPRCASLVRVTFPARWPTRANCSRASTAACHRGQIVPTVARSSAAICLQCAAISLQCAFICSECSHIS